MPSVKKNEFQVVWTSICRVFEEKEGIHLENADSYPTYFLQLAEWLNLDNPYKINSTYLYKEIYIEKLGPKKSETIYLRKQFLQCLYYKYPNKKENATVYEDEFYAIESKRARKTGIKKIGLIKKLRNLAKPEFPPDNPAYPATPHLPLSYRNYKKLIMKNEYYNPTGTHKDRFALEIIRYYSNKLAAYFNSRSKFPEPRLSIISSGSAAIAIQSLLNAYDFPALKVLYDSKHLSPDIVNAMRAYGCELYEHELSITELTPEEVLYATNNKQHNSISLSPLSKIKEFESLRFTFYDWLSIEILNQNPDYCIIPFGSGNLFENILHLNKMQHQSQNDLRFFGDPKILKRCQFIGATCRYQDIKTRMDKLYSPFNTFKEFKWRDYKNYCSSHSQIIEVQDVFLHKALEFAYLHNIPGEPSGLASLALFFQLDEAKKLDPEKKVLIVNTGKLKIDLPQKEKKEKLHLKDI